MNKYGTLPVDLSTLATETYAYLLAHYEVEDSGHHINAFNPLDLADLKASVPSMDAVFSSLGLNVAWCAHRTVNGNSMLRHPMFGNTLLVPLHDCENTVLRLYDVAPGATMIDDYYSGSDTTLSATVPLSSPVLVTDQTCHQIYTTDINLSDILIISFDAGDTATLAQYFA